MKPESIAPEPIELVDNYDRTFPYLRLSVTDICNFRCEYCLPDGYQCRIKPEFLSLDEIRRLVTAFAELGVWKIRLTGGEPSLRQDFSEIIDVVSHVPGIKNTAFTTNGYRLKDNAQKWYDAGTRHLNVSIDSLRKEVFHKITGHDRLTDVLAGIEQALAVGYSSVKINVVLLKGINDISLDDYLDYVRHRPVTVRFIELMQTGDNLAYFKKRHLSSDVIRTRLLEQGWVENIRVNGAGPAVNFTHPDHQGAIGLIAPYSKDFCQGCNRLRITATGDLRLCLFGEVGIPLRDLLQSDDQKPALQKRILKQLDYKKSTHFLTQGETGLIPNLSSTGG
ncbi:Cyclic pyranopterin phosphate synthase (MoaA) [hydrothermal vent metagenome]|uniref:GTP 3',8-cyclase n=1 Tax=hydrothermal vent metagenome TaxID=652676 RepID=A0A3B0RUK7_9ZZZZ